MKDKLMTKQFLTKLDRKLLEQIPFVSFWLKFIYWLSFVSYLF